jgi:hypothetical protein
MIQKSIAREIVPFKNHLASFLYSLDSKFLALDVGHMCRK